MHPGQVAQTPKAPKAQIVDFVEKYSAGLPKVAALKATGASTAVAVLLTGSTGNLGSHILASLLQSSDVATVYTVDRGSSPLERLKSSFEDRGLSVSLLQSKKLVALGGDLSKSDLGLEKKVLEQVSTTLFL